jgi:hypothetical protein
MGTGGVKGRSEMKKRREEKMPKWRKRRCERRTEVLLC